MRAFDETELIQNGGDIRVLDLSSCSLNELPFSVRALASSLEILNVTWNQLRSLPEWLGELQMLTYLDCSFNQLEVIPTSLQRLYRLKELHLSDNNLQSLPELGTLTALTSLNLQYNQLEHIPASSSQLSRLRTINVSGNPLPACYTQLKDTETSQSSTEDSSDAAFSFPLDIRRPKWRAESEALGRREQDSALLTREHVGYVRQSHKNSRVKASGRDCTRGDYDGAAHGEWQPQRTVAVGTPMERHPSRSPQSSPPATPPPLRVSLPTNLGDWVTRAASGAMVSRSVQDAISIARMLAAESPATSLPQLPLAAHRVAGDSHSAAVSGASVGRRHGRLARPSVRPEAGRQERRRALRGGAGQGMSASTVRDGSDEDDAARDGVCSQFLCPITREVSLGVALQEWLRVALTRSLQP